MALVVRDANASEISGDGGGDGHPFLMARASLTSLASKSACMVSKRPSCSSYHVSAILFKGGLMYQMVRSQQPQNGSQCLRVER